jgi:hypothetical protein
VPACGCPPETGSTGVRHRKDEVGGGGAWKEGLDDAQRADGGGLGPGRAGAGRACGVVCAGGGALVRGQRGVGADDPGGGAAGLGRAVGEEPGAGGRPRGPVLPGLLLRPQGRPLPLFLPACLRLADRALLPGSGARGDRGAAGGRGPAPGVGGGAGDGRTRAGVGVGGGYRGAVLDPRAAVRGHGVEPPALRGAADPGCAVGVAVRGGRELGAVGGVPGRRLRGFGAAVPERGVRVLRRTAGGLGALHTWTAANVAVRGFSRPRDRLPGGFPWARVPGDPGWRGSRASVARGGAAGGGVCGGLVSAGGAELAAVRFGLRPQGGVGGGPAGQRRGALR